ncbi:purine-nucleoside phosphorylase, partial [Enterococcus faecalis]
VTKAGGGVNESYSPGNLLLINDQINFTGDNQLIGENDEEIGPRFPYISHAYTQEYREVAKKVAAEQNIDLKEGVYMGFSGATYETPAESRMSRTMGA